MFSKYDNMEELWSKKVPPYYIQLIKFSLSVNVEVRQVLFYLNLKKANRLYFKISYSFSDIIGFIEGQKS